MKLNIANPATGLMKVIDVDDEKKLRMFYDQRMASEVSGDSLGEEWTGYVFRISGGNDKQGFPMVQGVMTQNRVRLLLAKGAKYYRPRCKGERKRKSVRGCIVSSEIKVLNLVVVKKGDKDVEGLTDNVLPKRLGPKRASNIRKLWGLEKDEDVRKFVIRREVKKGDKVIARKAPKIQRLVTPVVLQRKRARLAEKKVAREHAQKEAAAYAALYRQRQAEARESAAASRRRSSRRGD
mmetsp:Transcript_140861/g.270207  ORF Transcript_140861/g.270207 Transcript_140861/m.270207 type:complete len:237 (+) Transcript_140861:21-731(+)